MVTAERAEPKTTKKRSYLVQLQIRNLLSRTTDISQDDLAKLVDLGIGNQWLDAVKVHGFDQRNRCQAGLELEINWVRHQIEVAVWGEKVTVKKTVWTEDVAPEVRNAVEVLNQAVNAELLRTAWRVHIAPGVDRERVRRELGLQDAPPITWAGTVQEQAFGVSELRELKVRLLIAESDELVPEVSGQQQMEEPLSKTLFERLTQVFGEG
jgi:hypothetical protein